MSDYYILQTLTWRPSSVSGYKCWIHLRWFHRWPKTKSSLKKTMWYRCQTWLQTPDTGRTPQQTSGRPLSNRLYSLNKAQNASITTKPGPLCPWPPSTNLHQWTLHNNNNNCLWTPSLTTTVYSTCNMFYFGVSLCLSETLHGRHLDWVIKIKWRK